MSNISAEVLNYFKLELLIARSCISLRQLFKHRYFLFTGGQIWDDTSACGSNYSVNVIGKNKKFSLTSIQKRSVSNGNSNEWDLTTLTTLLLNYDRPKHLNATEIKQLDIEDAQLLQLRNIRNALAHHHSKNISDTDFNQHWSDLKTILLAFGDVNNEIDKLNDDSIFDPSIQTINEDNMKEILRLNSLGLCAYQEHRYSDAIILFTKAIGLPDVPNRERAIAYSNMSLSRLLLYEKEELTHSFDISNPNDQRYQALQDAKQARNILSTWWKGHFCVGKVYVTLNEYEKAIQSFERAFVLDSTNDEIQIALNESRQIQSRQLRYESLDPRLKPTTMPELLHEVKEKLGVDPQDVRLGHSLGEKIYPPGADVVRGHKYALGDINVKQDYKQAAKYFTKAAEKGDAEGMYNLGLLYDGGLGVKKDIKRATALFEQAANQPLQHPILKHLRNPGVAEAEHALGLRYADGIDVKKNLAIAAQWYQRASEHGSGQAANNLGIMYQKGTGIEQNMEKAEELFELSARRDDSNGMLNLAELLLNKGDLELSKIWYDRACKAGNILAQMDSKTFEAALHQRQQLKESCPSEFLEIINQMKNEFDLLHTQNMTTEASNNSNTYDYNVLKPYADNGSITAQKLCNALTHFAQALDILLLSPRLKEKQENRFIRELAHCYRIYYQVAEFPSAEIHKKVEGIIDRVLQRCNKKSNPTVSQLDEDVRICYATLHIDSHQLIAQFLEQCKTKYPKSIYFFILSATVYGYLEQYESCLYNINTGLAIDPSCCDLLYKRAILLAILDEDDDKIIEAYGTFLDIAPEDHPKIPQMYYIIAQHILSRSDNDSTMDITKIIYKQGIEAEKLQLPCFLPFTSKRKMILESVFNMNVPPVFEATPSNNHNSHLTNQYRIEVITAHRQYEAEMLEIGRDPKRNWLPISLKPRLKQPKAKSLVGLKTISLRDMDPTEDRVYIGYKLSVKIIETTYLWSPSIHLIVEDGNLDCERMCIYDFPESHGEYLINNVYTIGTKMHIINPYLRIGAGDLKPLIRVDESSSIVMQGESEVIVKMCRCCGQPNAPHVCKICEARYCSKECQTMDWKVYKHKLICRK